MKLYITHSHLRGWSIKQTNESLKVGRKPLGEESDRERVDLGNVTAANMSDIFVLKIKKNDLLCNFADSQPNFQFHKTPYSVQHQ